jgi:pyrimidine oxygenase
MESLTMMAGIAAATKRVKLWATVHPLLQNPAVAAKMITTLDHISGGRAGLNIVAGAYQDEFSQMGAWDPTLNHDDRYALADEWTTVLKRLWTEPSVDFYGRFFQMRDCVSEPKPVSQPRPQIICAGMSERGFQFAVRHSDAVFVGGHTPAERRKASRRAKAVARRMGGQLKTYSMCTLIHADTDAQAVALMRRYAEGADMGAIIAMLRHWGMPQDQLQAAADAQGAFMTETAVGSPASCAEQIAAFMDEAELDGLMLIFPDYVDGLAMFGAEILPRLRASA